MGKPIEDHPAQRQANPGTNVCPGYQKYGLSFQIEQGKSDQRNEDDVRTGWVVQGILGQRAQCLIEGKTRNYDKRDEADMPSSLVRCEYSCSSRGRQFMTSTQWDPTCKKI